MAKQVGNPGMGPNVNYRETGLPSTHDRSRQEYTDSFPSSTVTHKHRSIRGENNQRGDTPYEAKGNQRLKRSGERVQPFADERSYRRPYESSYSAHDGHDLYSGRLSKGQKYADETMSKSWDHKTGKSKGAGFEPGNGGRRGLSASG